MATDLCSLTVEVNPSCAQIQANWTVLETIRLFFCCLQTADFFKHKINKRFQWPSHSSSILNFNVPVEYEICLLDTDADAAIEEVKVYLEGVLQYYTTAVLDTTPASVGFYNITLLGSTFTVTFGGPEPDNCRVQAWVPVCLAALDC